MSDTGMPGQGYDERMMRLALAEAAMVEGDVPVGAVVVYGGEVIARAHNRREQDNLPFAHAEMLALDQAAKALGRRRLKGCSLYVSLEPCPMCAGALILAQIDRCVFAAFDIRYGCCGSVYALPLDPHFSHRVAISGGVLEAEAKALLDGFFAARRSDP